jgi:DNA-binding MarR family transcriptional regulator
MMSAKELDAVADLRIALNRFVAVTEAVARAHELTPRQYDLLAVLHRGRNKGDEATPTSVATELSLSRSASTELLSRAVKAGLIERRADQADLRVKHVTPTPEGTRRFLGAAADLRIERKRLLDLLRIAAGLMAAMGALG